MGKTISKFSAVTTFNLSKQPYGIDLMHLNLLIKSSIKVIFKFFLRFQCSQG